MPGRSSSLRVVVMLVLALGVLAAQEVKRTYAIRMGQRVVGYQVETERAEEVEGKPAIRFDTKSLTKVEVLGARVDQVVEQTWVLDPETRAVRQVDSRLEAESIEVAVEGRLEEQGFVVREKGGTGSGTVLDPLNVVISPEFRWLAERGPKEIGPGVDVVYFIPEAGGAKRAKVTLGERADREISVLGESRSARVYRIAIGELGIVFDVAVDRETQETLRYEIPAMDLVIERAPAAVIARLERADLTDVIVVRTNLDIEDPSTLTSMKLKVTIQSTPDVTVESLNVAGQRFAGTVTNGRIEGIFEIRPARSDGTGAPAFPVPEGVFGAEELKPWLAPEEGIESDDPRIAATAREVAAGARTCFEVVERLSEWVSRNITYSIPGGMTARRVFERREGECGGHSHLLAAMLRSLGIPARTPMGGMYIPLYGGSFGQHMWNEVYLGEAIGWLPVDCTAGQATFIDAGHVRLKTGVTVFRPLSIEVLDYEPKAAPTAEPAVRRETGPYPYEPGETLVYAYSIGGTPIGDEKLTYRGEGDGGHVFESSLSFPASRYTETTRTVVGDDGRLIAFRAERKVADATSTYEVSMTNGKATLSTKTPDGDRTDTVAAGPTVFPLHNNCIAHFAIPLSRLGPLEEGSEVKVRLLHDEVRSVIPMTLRGGKAGEIEIAGAARKAHVCTASLFGFVITLHTDERGRLLRFHQDQGDVVIQLKGS